MRDRSERQSHANILISQASEKSNCNEKRNHGMAIWHNRKTCRKMNGMNREH